MEKSKGVYIMSVAAGLVQMHPQTLRKYENYGLLKPGRIHKLRLYSENDIQRLQQIKELAGLGVNMAGMKIIFGVTPYNLNLPEEKLDGHSV